MFYLHNYTLLQNKRGRWFRVPHLPHHSLENQWRNINILYIILMFMNPLEIKVLFKFFENILISRLYKEYSWNYSAKDWSRMLVWKKLKLSKYATIFKCTWLCSTQSGDFKYVITLAKYLTFAILEHLRNFAKAVLARIYPKVKCLAKQFVLMESPDQVL